MMPTTEDIFTRWSQRLEAAGANALPGEGEFLFIVQGEEKSERWTLTLGEENALVSGKGRGGPDAQIRMTAQQLRGLAAGSLNPQEEFASGRLMTVGELAHVVRLSKALERLLAWGL